MSNGQSSLLQIVAARNQMLDDGYDILYVDQLEQVILNFNKTRLQLL